MSNVIEQVDLRHLEQELANTPCRSSLRGHTEPHDADWWAVAPCQDVTPVCEAHFSSECLGAMLGGYVIQMFGSNVEDIEDAGVRTLREVPATQNIVTTMGLTEYMAQTVKDQLSWGATDGDDD